MTNTPQSFRDKWNNNQRLAFEETLKQDSDIFRWILSRNGFSNVGELKSFLSRKKRILDAGCGNGRVTALLRQHSNSETTEIVGVDLVASQVAQSNLANYSNISFYSKDLLGELKDIGKFDFIYCQEVLHHTADPQQAFLNLCTLLSERGEIAIYVYKKKAPAREFVDDFIRDKISNCNYEEAMNACKQITELGKRLSELDITINVPQVDVLEIEAGEHSLQRFIYHFFMKCFWNPDMSFLDNAVINYDWYHPQISSRHTLAEVRLWFSKGGISISHECVDHYGITVRGLKI